MSMFRCEKCGCMENTALGMYWCKDMDCFKEEYRGKALCSECAPKKFINGSDTRYKGWHNKFEKKTPEEWGTKESELINGKL